MKTSDYFKNFFKGFASAFDLFPSTPYIKIDNRSDEEKMKSDWENVGKDMWKALGVLTHGRNERPSDSNNDPRA